MTNKKDDSSIVSNDSGKTEDLPGPLAAALEEAGVDAGDTKVLKILQALEITHTRMAVSSGSHALPPAMMLEEWEQLYPGITKKFVGWLDQQTKHRQAIEKERAARAENRADRGQIITGIAMALGLIGATVVGIWGSWIASVALAIVCVGGPAAATILASRGITRRLPPSS